LHHSLKEVEVMAGKISLYGAVVSMLRFFFGFSSKKQEAVEQPKEPTPEPVKEKPKEEKPKTEPVQEKPKEPAPAKPEKKKISDKQLCPKCSTEMNMVAKNSNDFISLFIHECPKCGTISEFQYEYGTENPIRISHIFVKDSGESSTFAEAEGFIPYDNFSLDRLWAIGGALCYPVIVKSEFTEKTSLIFIKAGHTIEFNSVEGFLISSSNVIGEIKMIREDTVSHFCNPYLAHLPRPEFNWVSSPTSRCDALETVYNIRFTHMVEGDENMKLHTLIIIKDMPLKVMGIEVYVRFNSMNNADEGLSMSDLIHKIDIQAIIMGTSVMNIKEDFAIQRWRVTKHTLSSLNNEDIPPDIRIGFWRDMRRFFSKYDKEAKELS
jgi:hypothetical protein